MKFEFQHETITLNNSIIDRLSGMVIAARRGNMQATGIIIGFELAHLLLREFNDMTNGECDDVSGAMFMGVPIIEDGQMAQRLEVVAG